MNKWFSFWNEAHPDTADFVSKIKELLLISLGIAAFLYWFKPFGLGAYYGNHVLLSLGFGMVTLTAGIALEMGMTYLLNIKKDLPTWTYGKWLLSTVALVFLIAIGNFIYLKLVLGEGDWASFPAMLFYTFLLALLPISIGGLVKQNLALRQNQSEANQINLKGAPVSKEEITFENGKESFSIASDLISHIESMQNYVAVHFYENGVSKKELIRSTLKEAAQKLPSDFMLCHRSYIVHLNQIEKVEGNAQGLKLHLKESDFIVPVSRKYIAEMRSRLSQKV